VGRGRVAVGTALSAISGVYQILARCESCGRRLGLRQPLSAFFKGERRCARCLSPTSMASIPSNADASELDERRAVGDDNHELNRVHHASLGYSSPGIELARNSSTTAADLPHGSPGRPATRLNHTCAKASRASRSP
jgi:hypothetical protein